MLDIRRPDADVLIVGAGLIGLMTAWRLAQLGQRVMLLEQAENVGTEASWAGGGIISPLFPWRYPDPVNVLASYGQQHYRALTQLLHEHTGIDPEYEACGLLMLDTPERPLSDMPEDWAQRWQARCERREDVSDIQPGLAPQPALWWPALANIRNPRLIQSLAWHLEHIGVRILTGVAVGDLVMRERHVVGVRSGQDDFYADKVIVTAGAWTGELFRRWGGHVPVRPVKGQMLLFRAEPGFLRRILLAGDCYLVPRRDGHILVGSTMEEAGFDKSPTHDAAAMLRDKAFALLPELARFPLERHWAGLRPGVEDQLPYIGPIPDSPNLFVCAGQFRNGIVMAPGSARLLSEMVLEQRLSFDPSPYALNRSP